MNKVALIVIGISLIFSACGPSAEEYSNTLNNSIDRAETLTTEHDAAVQRALEENTPDSIISATKHALSSLIKEQEQIKTMQIAANGETLNAAAGNYINALVNFIKTQSEYADYSDSLSDEDIEILDKKNSDAMNVVITYRTKLTEAQKIFLKSKSIIR